MAENINIFNEMYNYIEQTSSEFVDKIVRDEAFLKGIGKLWEGYLDYRAVIDKMIQESLKSLNVANKKDQEKVLFKLSQLESNIKTISRNLDKLEK
jgi:hypothetical protein